MRERSLQGEQNAGNLLDPYVLDNLSCPVFIVNQDTSIGYINPALEKLTGFTAAELIGRKAPYPWWSGSTTAREFKEALHTGMNRQKRFKKKDGEYFWVEAVVIPMKTVNPFVLIAWTDITATKQRSDNMELYLAQVTRSQEEERKDLAHEIHDILVQSLSAISLDIDDIARYKAQLPCDMVARLERLRDEIAATINQARAYSNSMHPGVFDYLNLPEALEILVEDANRGGIKTELEISGSEHPLPYDKKICLFRIAQGALDNVRKHAQAKEASIRVRFTGRNVQMIISDNGRGFEIPAQLTEMAKQGKLGLIGMAERARLSGGKISLKSLPDKGTRVTVVIPAT